jgi:hypothetical protein
VARGRVKWWGEKRRREEWWGKNDEKMSMEG